MRDHVGVAAGPDVLQEVGGGEGFLLIVQLHHHLTQDRAELHERAALNPGHRRDQQCATAKHPPRPVHPSSHRLVLRKFD